MDFGIHIAVLLVVIYMLLKLLLVVIGMLASKLQIGSRRAAQWRPFARFGGKAGSYS